MVTDTIGFSRMEFQFQPPILFFEEDRPKLKLLTAEAGGYLKRVRAWFRLKLMNHTRLKAGGIQRVSTRSR